MGKNVLRKHFLSPKKKGRKAHVFKDSCSYSMTLICNANKQLLRGKDFFPFFLKRLTFMTLCILV